MRLEGLATALGLFTTGSSDYHRTNKTVRLGAHLTPEASYDALVGLAQRGGGAHGVSALGAG